MQGVVITVEINNITVLQYYSTITVQINNIQLLADGD